MRNKHFIEFQPNQINLVLMFPNGGGWRQFVELGTLPHTFQFLSEYFIASWHEITLAEITACIDSACKHDRTVAIVFLPPYQNFQPIHIYVYGSSMQMVKGKLYFDNQTLPVKPSLLLYRAGTITVTNF